MSAQPIPFRSVIRSAVPWWLRRFLAFRILYVIALHIDALADAALAAVKHRFPNYYSGESLPLIGRARRIRRGRLDTDASYAVRLRKWRPAHQRRGSARQMLRMLFAHFAPAAFKIELVNYLGTRYTSAAADGAITRDAIVWAPDADATKWARWWLFYHWPVAVAHDGIWSDAGAWDDGGVWDSNLSPTEVADLRAVPNEWHAEHAIGKLVLLSPGLEIADYVAAASGTAVVGLN